MISQKEKELYLKDSPHLVLPRRQYSRVPGQSQQQQQQPNTSERAASSTRKLVRKEDEGTPTENTEPPSIWKQMRSAESLVEKEEPEFKVDLRIEEVAQDVIRKDEEIMEIFLSG